MILLLKLCILDAKTLGNDIDLSGFETFGQVFVYQITKPEEVVERIKDQNVIITNKVVLNETNLQHAPELKLICITATGTNNIDLAYAKEHNIAVTNVAGYSTNSVAQHTFAMLLYLLEQLSYYDRYVKSGEYAKSEVFTNLNKPFWELRGKTFGIIGLGEIGRSVAAVANAFGSNVVYYSTSGANYNEEYQRVDFDELLRTSDVVSIHAPLNERTKNLIRYDQLKMMKGHAILLNLGRGGIVNENDLAKALDEELIAGAALDVLEREPIQNDNPLLNVKNSDRLLIVPHIAWASIEARKKLVNEVMLNIESYLKGEERNRV